MAREALDLDFVRRRFPALGQGWTLFDNAGVVHYNTVEEVDRLVRALDEAL